MAHDPNFKWRPGHRFLAPAFSGNDPFYVERTSDPPLWRMHQGVRSIDAVCVRFNPVGSAYILRHEPDDYWWLHIFSFPFYSAPVYSGRVEGMPPDAAWRIRSPAVLAYADARRKC